MGFVNINGILVPESSKPAEPFACMLPGCGSRFSTPERLERHVALHMRRQEQEIRELSVEERMPEFFAGDTERREYLRSPRGRAEWARKTGDHTVLE